MTKTINQAIGAQIRVERERRQLTGTEFGQRLAEYLGAPGWTRQTVYEAETGRRDFRISDLVAISLAHHIQLYELVEGPKQIEISSGRVVDGERVIDCFSHVVSELPLGRVFRALRVNQELLEAVEDASKNLKKASDRATHVRETLSALFAPNKISVTTHPPSVRVSVPPETVTAMARKAGLLPRPTKARRK